MSLPGPPAPLVAAIALLLATAACEPAGPLHAGGTGPADAPLESFLSVEGALLPADVARSATSLRAQPRCDVSSPSRPVVHLSWSVARAAGREQRIGLTTHVADFEGRDFAVTLPLAEARDSYALDRGVSPGTIHYWQVLTRQADGWVPSAVGTFEGPVCVADLVTNGS